MEVKFGLRKHSSLLKSLLSNHTEKIKFAPHTFCFKSWAATDQGNRFKGLVKEMIWVLSDRSGDCETTAARTIPVVMCGETLSCISKMYGVSVNSIAAANKDILDIDLVFKGQLLNIPAPSLLETQLEQAKKIRLCHSICALKRPSQQKFFTMLTSHGLSNAKTSGYFLVLVPLVTFCIRCIISTFRPRVARDLKHQAVDKSQGHYPRAKSIRWKSALSDDAVEGDVFDSELEIDSNNPSEDEAYISCEEASHAYARLERDYQKFLSECGISKWGYWRGGSPGD